MIDPALLLAYAADALDPSRREEVERALACSDTLRSALEVARRHVDASDPAIPTWRVPPPGFGIPLQATLIPHLGAAPARVRVEFPGVQRVVVLRWRADDWEVVAVHDRVGALDLDGGERWAVALPEAGWRAEEDPGWTQLRAGIADGRVAVAAIRRGSS